LSTPPGNQDFGTALQKNIYSFNKYLFIACYLPSTVLNTGDRSFIIDLNKSTGPHGTYILLGKFWSY
jgi:hypothetical protein